MNDRFQREEEEFRRWFDASEREIAVLKARVFAQIHELTELLLKLQTILSEE